MRNVLIDQAIEELSFSHFCGLCEIFTVEDAFPTDLTAIADYQSTLDYLPADCVLPLYVWVCAFDGEDNTICIQYLSNGAWHVLCDGDTTTGATLREAWGSEPWRKNMMGSIRRIF